MMSVLKGLRHGTEPNSTPSHSGSLPDPQPAARAAEESLAPQLFLPGGLSLLNLRVTDYFARPGLGDLGDPFLLLFFDY